jgi:hypothetical protein
MSKVFDTKMEAESWIAQQAYELDIRGDLFTGVTLSKLWPIYAKSRAGTLTRKTMATYKWNVEKKWLSSIGNMDVTLVTPATVQRVLEASPTRTRSMRRQHSPPFCRGR